MNERKNSEARIKANNKYNAKAYDRINIAIPKGQKDVIESAAKEAGKSINGYVVEAVAKQLVADGKPSIIETKDGEQ